MAFRRTVEDRVLSKLVGKGSRKGSTPFERAGDIIQHLPAWAGVAAVLAVFGPRGRRAAVRGGACSLVAAAAHLPIKAVIGGSHPRGAAWLQARPFTSSLPSGHAGSDVAFALGASQEVPLLFLPLSGATLAVHGSLMRKRGHYASDVLVGAALGIVVALAAWKLWPPRGRAPETDEPASELQSSGLGVRPVGWKREGATSVPVATDGAATRRRGPNR